MIKTIAVKKSVAILLTLIFASLQMVFAAETPVLNRKVLMENKVELTNKHVTAKTIRVTFPPAFKTPQHTHEGPGPRYVVKGKLKVIEGGKTNIYKAGDVFWESGQLMSVENLSGQVAEMIIVELVPAIQ
jgi:quercetin dioxygenase-like cupin family protein